MDAGDDDAGTFLIDERGCEALLTAGGAEIELFDRDPANAGRKAALMVLESGFRFYCTSFKRYGTFLEIADRTLKSFSISAADQPAQPFEQEEILYECKRNDDCKSRDYGIMDRTDKQLLQDDIKSFRHALSIKHEIRSTKYEKNHKHENQNCALFGI